MKIIVVARVYYVLRYFICILFGALSTIFVVTSLNIKDSRLLFLILFGISTYLAYRATSKIDKGEVHLEILEDGLRLTWLKQFYFHNRESRVIEWNEIESYVFEPDQHYDIFKIRLKSKKKIKFSLKETTDEFFKFLSEFEYKINELKTIDPTITITKSKTFYETTPALIMAYILGLIIIGLVGFMIFGEPNKSPNYGMLITSLSGAIFLIFQVYSHRKNRNII